MRAINFNIGIFICILTTFSCAYVSVYVYSYLPEMIKWLGFKEYEKGYYAGWIAASYFLGSGIFSYFWGWMSDKYGRKSTIVFLLIVTGIFCLLFGFCQNFHIAMVIRFCDGAVNGYQAVINALLYYYCDDRNQGIAASLVISGWGLGFSLGPLVAGYLAAPVDKYPHSFSKTGIFMKYPYLLPNIITCILQFLIAALVFALLPATPYHCDKQSEFEECNDYTYKQFQNIVQSESPSNQANTINKEMYKEISPKTQTKPDNKYDNLSNATSLIQKDNKQKSKIKWIMEILSNNSLIVIFKIPNIFHLMFSNFVFYFGVMGLWEICPVVLSTSRAQGGLGFTSSEIGLLYGSTSLAGLVLQSIVIPRLEKRFGLLTAFVIVNTTFSIFTSITGLLAVIPSWALKPILYIHTSLIIMLVTGAVSLMTVIINNLSDLSSVGKVNGLAQIIASIAKAITPVVGGTIFSSSIISTIGPPMDTSTVFVVFGLTLYISSLTTYFLPHTLNTQNK